MEDQKPRIPLLQQREIEAGIVGPVVRAFAEEVGQERAIAVLRKVITELARQSAQNWLGLRENTRSKRLQVP